MERLLACPERPRAVLCAYDSMAIGAMRCARDHGIRIPEDMAFIGMDNLPETQYLEPPLASVEMHTDEICREAVRILMERINGGDAEVCIVPSAFVLRASAEIHRKADSAGANSTPATTAATENAIEPKDG